MGKWLKNKVVIRYIVIFALISTPVVGVFLNHYYSKSRIETALHQIYKEYCHEDVKSIEVNANIIQPFSFLPGGAGMYWSAVTSSARAPVISGRYGKEMITANLESCSNYTFILERGHNSFTPVEDYTLDPTDKAGVHIFGVYFILLAYFLYFSSIIIILLVKGIRIVFTKLRGHE